MRGLLLYFDGPDGAGKTTQLQLAEQALTQAGRTVYVTRALGGSTIGEQLRTVALNDVARPVETDLHIALACQYAQAADLVARREQGDIVLVDRSPLSIIGYQVFGDGLDPSTGYEAADALIKLLQPDKIMLYNAADELLQARRKQRNQEDDYFESKPSAYHRRVADGFDEAAEHFKADVISANGTAEEVHQATMKLLEPLLEA